MITVISITSIMIIYLIIITSLIINIMITIIDKQQQAPRWGWGRSFSSSSSRPALLGHSLGAICKRPKYAPLASGAQ